MPRFAANLTMLFTEVEFLDRFALAARSGFSGVEFLFPYAYAASDITERLQQHGLTQVLFNLPPGNWDAGERGIACLPDRVDEFRRGVELALQYATALGCAQLNCLAGLKPDHVSNEMAWQTLRENVRYAAEMLEPHGVTLMLEAINSRIDMPGFFLDSSAKVRALIDEVQHPNIKFQYDIYHMQIMEGDIIRRLQELHPYIGHIQFADNPGRHEPGTGELNFPVIFKALDTIGYKGWVSAEYRPGKSTLESLSWLSD